MTARRASRMPLYSIILNVCLLQSIGIKSFQLGRNNPAFRICDRCHTQQGRKQHDVVVLSPLFAELSSITAENDYQQQQQYVHQNNRHDIFQHTNAVSKSFPIPHPSAWRKFVTPSEQVESNCNNKSTPSFWEQLLSSAQLGTNHNKRNQLVNDVTVEFDDPSTGAYELVKQCHLFPCDEDDNYDKEPNHLLPENTMMEQEIIHHLTDVLSYFQSVASNGGSSNIKCQARIVSSIGKNGIKCPRWHADHVPVRLVMSIIGPGCEYIPHEVEVMGSNARVVDRKALNTLDEDDTQIANDIILPPHLNNGKTVVTSAKEGDAVLLMGRAWEDSTTLSGDFTSEHVLAAVHRSPLLSPGQERILLTVDIVPPSL